MTAWMAAMIGATANAAAACAQPSDFPANLGAPGLPSVDCAAKAPAIGQTFAGAVLKVIDGRSICVAKGPSPSDWVRATLDDSPDASARPAVMAALFARRVDCEVVGRGQDGVIARCTLAGEPVGRLIDSAANREAALAWR